MFKLCHRGRDWSCRRSIVFPIGLYRKPENLLRNDCPNLKIIWQKYSFDENKIICIKKTLPPEARKIFSIRLLGNSFRHKLIAFSENLWNSRALYLFSLCEAWLRRSKDFFHGGLRPTKHQTPPMAVRKTIFLALVKQQNREPERLPPFHGQW